jgi:nicotinate-nucleotide adenylyltransferase
MGADLIDQFPRWRNPEQIVKLASLIILGRQGVPPPVAPIPENSRLLIDVCLPSMSSTAIRARLARGEDVSDLVPAPVLAQIRLLGMYEPDPQ